MDYVVFIIYRLITGTLSALPLTVVFCIGRFLGAAACCLAPKYRRLVIRNLTIAFEGEKTEREIRRLALEHFSILGANLLSSVKLATMSREAVHARVRWENSEIITGLAKQGGVIGVISHIGNWELFARIPEFLPGPRFSTIYQKLGNRHIDECVRKSRAQHGVETFERKEGFNGPVKFLRDGGTLAVLVDQHAGDGGLWSPLFDRLASTSPLAATVAFRTGSPVIPVAVYTEGLARWKFIVSEPLRSGTGSIEMLTAEINQALERQIRVAPRDWFWVHNRWKTPRPNFLLANYKRGIQYPENYDVARLKPFRILIRSSNWLGDAVMSVPAVRAIKCGRPDAKVSILTRAKLADFWKLVPEVDEVISIGEEDKLFSVAKKISTGFDVAILFPNSIRTALEVWLAGIPRRVGFVAKWRGPFLNQILPKEARSRPPEHQLHHYLRLAEFSGAFKGIDSGVAQFLLPGARPKRFESKMDAPFRIGLCPGADYGPAKRWFPERFAEVMKIVSQHRRCEWVMFGTEKDLPVGEEILNPRPRKLFSPADTEPPARDAGESDAGVPVPSIEQSATADLPVANCTNLIGRTTMEELIAELSRCDLLVTNDTGTMHLAAFLGVPTVSIFGSTEPVLTGPMGAGHRVLRHHVECSPCFLRECPLDFRCMKAVTADEVVEAVLQVLEQNCQ